MLLPMEFAVITFDQARVLVEGIEKLIGVENGYLGSAGGKKLIACGLYDVHNKLNQFLHRKIHYENELDSFYPNEKMDK